jgi:sugar lactone lactonase YvrE
MDRPGDIALPGEQTYPESISASSDGDLYVSSLATGGVWRIKPDTKAVREWIRPGAFGTRSLSGVAIDPQANLLWVCSNDLSSSGIPGPSNVTGSFLKGFDLTSGMGKVSAELPGKAAVCNDIVIASDGSLFVTNSAAPQILRLKPGYTKLEVWIEAVEFEQPLKGAPGLDGIAFGGDGSLYVNNFSHGSLFRVEVKGATPGEIVKLKPSRRLKGPDGMRAIGERTFVVAEEGGRVSRISVEGDRVTVETITHGLAGPTSVSHVNQTLWISEGQLSHLFKASKHGPPRLPFRIVGVPFQKGSYD